MSSRSRRGKPAEIEISMRSFLGRVVAEGFLAVEAQDREAIRSIGRTVLSVAEELGLRSAVIKHTKGHHR